MSKRAIITGITGQDGSYLAELLLEQGYEVIGVVRRSSAPNLWRIEHLLDRIQLRPADLLDQLSHRSGSSRVRAARVLQPRGDVVCAGVVGSADADGEFNSQGVTRVLEAIRQVDPQIRFYQASSSEMFGKVREVPQTELTPFYPAARTASPKCSATTSRSTIGRATVSSRVRGSCSITSRPGAASSS